MAALDFMRRDASSGMTIMSHGMINKTVEKVEVNWY